MFLDYSELHIKFLKYQLLICSPVKRYWFPRWFFWFFWLSFLAIISAARNCHCFLHQITKKEFNIYIIYMIKLEILVIYIKFHWIIQFAFMNSIFFLRNFSSRLITQFVYIFFAVQAKISWLPILPRIQHSRLPPYFNSMTSIYKTVISLSKLFPLLGNIIKLPQSFFKSSSHI